MIFKIKKEKIILIIVIFFAFLLRFINLENWPKNFNQDEALNGYEAYSILETGRDHRNNPWPIFFEGFSDKTDNRLPLYIYTSVPSIAAFGLNKFSTRLPAVIFGVLTVLVTYFLTKQLFKKEAVALLAAFFVTLSPWHIFLSRMGLEVITVPLFFVLSILFVLKGFEEKKYFFILAGISLAFLFYTYHIAKIFPPLLIIFLLFVFRKKIKENKKYLLITLLIFIICSLPFLLAQINNWDRIQERFNQLTILNNSFIWPIILIKNLLSYFSPKFFLLHYLFFVTLSFLVSLIFLLKTKQRWVIWLIFISLLPATLLIDNPHSHHSMVIIPFIEIISAFGVFRLIESFKNIKKIKIFNLLVIFFIVISILNINYLINNNYPYRFLNGFYRYVPVEVLDYIKENQDKYERVVFTNKASQPYIYFLFYLKYDPQKIQTTSFIKRIYLPNKSQIVVSFDKYTFCDIDICYSPSNKNLYVAQRYEIPSVQEKKIFYDINNNQFRIITND